MSRELKISYILDKEKECILMHVVFDGKIYQRLITYLDGFIREGFFGQFFEENIHAISTKNAEISQWLKNLGVTWEEEHLLRINKLDFEDLKWIVNFLDTHPIFKKTKFQDGLHKSATYNEFTSY
jgi:hypothetical protein